MPNQRSFQWRGETYQLESSTWHFWGRARLIRLPGTDDEFCMTPDDARFIHFAVNAGCQCQADQAAAEQVAAGENYLAQNNYRVWRVQDALALVREDSESALAARLLDRLCHWFFVAKY